MTANTDLASAISAATINVLLSILGTIGNLPVLMVIFLNIRRASASNILLANLAAIDLLRMFYVVPGAI